MPTSTQTHTAAVPRSLEEVEHIVAMERLHRYNHGLPCGASALRRHLREEIGLHPRPSLRRIRQILTLYGLSYGRTGWYDGEDLERLPNSARVPEARRRHFSMLKDHNDR